MKIGTRSMAVMASLVALNVAIGGLVHVLKIPIFLDAIGTILAVLLLGRNPGIVVGVLSFLAAAAFVNPVYVWFVGTQAVIAIFIFIAADRFSAFKTPIRAIVAGLGLGLAAGVASAPVIVAVFGGVSGSGRDLITVALVAAGRQVYRAVILSGAASEPVDKILQTLAAYYVLKSLPKSLLARFRNPVLEKNGLV